MSLFRKLSQLMGNFTVNDGVIALTYHRVNDKLPPGELVVHPAEFKKQMMFLDFYRKHFEVIGVSEMAEWLNGAPRSPGTKIVITFDDGYRDNYIHAYPVLKKYKFQAVVFLATGYAGTEQKNDEYKNVPWKRDFLNKDEISEMMDGGISFGAHTETHPRLTRIGDIDAEREISKSKKYIESNFNPLNQKISIFEKEIAFCYPYGDYNEKVKEMVKKAGFSCAFTVMPGINYREQDLFEIKRAEVTGKDNFSSFKYKITDKYKL